jgi:arsenate reductase
MTNTSVFNPRPSAPGLLFLCVANAARSQIAEGLARARFGDRVMVQSAGSRPGTLNPHAVAVLAEIGIDSARQRSKHVDTIESESVTTVVTLCEEEVCPAFLGAAVRLAWPMQDPVGEGGSEMEQRERFRMTRREIARRLDGLVV